MAESAQALTMQEKLWQLRHASNAAIQEIKPTNPVLWSNLRCTEACFVTTDQGAEYYSVLIQEADPDAVELQLAVKDHLARIGWLNIVVKTEW